MKDVEDQVDEEQHREPLIGVEGRMLGGVDQGPYEQGPASEQRRDQRDDSVAPPRRGCGGSDQAGGAGHWRAGELWLREGLWGGGDSGR